MSLSFDLDDFMTSGLPWLECLVAWMWEIDFKSLAALVHLSVWIFNVHISPCFMWPMPTENEGIHSTDDWKKLCSMHTTFSWVLSYKFSEHVLHVPYLSLQTPHARFRKSNPNVTRFARRRLFFPLYHLVKMIFICTFPTFTVFSVCRMKE